MELRIFPDIQLKDSVPASVSSKNSYHQCIVEKTKQYTLQGHKIGYNHDKKVGLFIGL